MSPGRLARLLAAVVLAATGAYVFIYLGRWEWNRALLAGVLFVAAEVALVASAVLDRLRHIDQRLDQPRPDQQIQTRIAEAAPPPREPFAWLRPQQDRLGVFVPILMGVGVLVSGVAWLVERIARATATPVLERRLAARLQPLAWPERRLEPAGKDVVSILEGPRR